LADGFARLEDREFQKALKDMNDQIKKVAGGANSYVKLVAPVAMRDVDDHFKKERGPSGKWQSWSEQYIKFLQAKGLSGNNILINSGKMRQSTVPAIGIKGRPGEIPILVNPAKTRSGFPYAQHHDEGGSAGKNKPRPFMWLSGAAIDKIGRLTLGFIKGKE